MTRWNEARSRARRGLLGAAMLLGACVRVPVTGTPAPASPASSTAASAPLTRPQLRAMLDSLVRAPAFRSAQWGILIVDPAAGDTLYSHNAGKLFMPASNQKLLTGATALATLGPDFRYRTTIAAAGRIESGVLNGDLAVLGSGDPSVSDAMQGGDAMRPLRAIADSLHARGVRRVAGRVVGARDAFPDSALGYGWAWDDLDYPYSAGVDELLFNEGFSRVIVQAGLRPGDPVQLRTLPARTVPSVDVRATTVEPRSDSVRTNTLALTGVATRPGDTTAALAVLTGTLAVGDTAAFEIAHRSPAGAYLRALTEALRDRGIAVDQGAREDSAAVLDSLFTIESPPLRDILPRMEKPSQNQIAEVLFKTVGLHGTGVGSADSARRVVELQLAQWGALPDGFVVRDGSGLSRHDYVTPETIVRVLDAMRRHPEFRLFYDALPVAGVDGTIRNRMKDTPAQGNVHAKTGTLDKARSLSGYVTTADGRLLVFSILANNWTVPVREVDRGVDAVMARLAAMRLGASTASR